MTTLAFDPVFRNNLLLWLSYCSEREKSELIDLIKSSMNISAPRRQSNLSKLFGAWAEDGKSAEQMITEISNGRNFSRQRENL